MPEVAQQLIDLLDTLDEASTFCIAGEMAPVLPGLEVDGIGDVGLPIGPVQARQLIEQAEQAPYGRGEETIVDTDVRRVWQLEPVQFTIHNPAWDDFMAEMVDAVKHELGMDQRVAWDLYKLLIYEAGNFFAPHRDSEKVDGMFATLVVNLPSRHEGGTLVVSHDSETRMIDFGGPAGAYNMQYAAFYTDCKHEIEPVTSGYRVNLIYNLRLAGRKRQPTAPRNSENVNRTAALLAELFTDGPYDKIAIPLAHEYSEAGLSLDMLKGSDRSRVDVLARAAEQLNYQLYLALLTHHQSGSVEDDWDYGGRWSSIDEDDAEMDEVFDESMTLSYWIDAQGHEKEFGEMTLDAEDILDPEGLSDTPSRQEVHEATGNEGVTMERWYHHGVIVLWPEERYFRILASEGQAAALPALAELIDSEPDPASSEAGRTFAREIINGWRLSQRFYGAQSSHAVEMLTQLQRLADADLMNQFLREGMVNDYSGSEGALLSALCDQFGYASLASALTHFIASQVPTERRASLKATVEIVADLCWQDSPMTDERRTVCRTLAGELQGVIDQWDRHVETAPWLRDHETREGIVESLFQALSAIEAPGLLESFLTHALTDPKHYDLHTVLIPAAKTLHHEIDEQSPGAASMRRLLQHCMDQLRDLTKTPVPVPADWAQDIEIRHNCEDCRELQKFLRDPEARVHRFRVRKDRRQHLHRQIDSHGCDMTHVTERKGSPQTLVCTKTRASYERRQRQFEIDTQLLEELREMAEA
ncbi:2OG-Fe(II) oxygenase [Candidatus Entotheonella palauensis]|nr:2OG-Fe(II) oxygenase [Candidatus Entotheonella palauensis]